MSAAYKRKKRGFPQLPTVDFLAAIIGLLIALLLSVLLTFPLSRLPGIWGQISPVIAGVILCVIFTVVTVAQGREIFQLFGVSVPEGVGGLGREGVGGRLIPRSGQLIVDTSSLIDGRIADIVQAGFIYGSLIIPRFVLEELHHIADSYEATRRNRGRRGLEVLNRLQNELDIRVEISEVDFKEIPDVDSKLVRLGKLLSSAIITNDFNLNQVAKIQGVQVLNINELANAVRPVVMPGEKLDVRVIQEGKEAGQGIGFLDDGTMIVVEDGRRYMNNELTVIVTRVLQTSAGRMIFAHLKTNGNQYQIE
ncbi:MAG: PIN domain nuclease [Chloroflexota bacterium]|nr:PIN domain nuclease [Chloroflexota bacterium]